MKKKSLSAIMIALLLTTEAATILPFASTLNTTPCPCEENSQCDKKADTNKKHKNQKDNMGFWNKDNINLLNDSQKKQLEAIRDKIQKGEALTDEDKKTLFELKDTIAKSKLGEEKFNKFKALMEKRKQGTELTDEETKELKQYLKELK